MFRSKFRELDRVAKGLSKQLSLPQIHEVSINIYLKNAGMTWWTYGRLFPRQKKPERRYLHAWWIIDVQVLFRMN